MESVIQLNHPVIKEKLAVLRSKDTSRASFRITMKELGKLLSYEVLRDFVTDKKEVDTPLAKTQGDYISELPIIVSVLRAGNILMEGILELIPNALKIRKFKQFSNIFNGFQINVYVLRRHLKMVVSHII